MKKPPLKSLKQLLSFPLVLALVLAQVFFPISNANAAQIVPRNLTLQAVGAHGGSAPGAVAPNQYSNHEFLFTIPTTGTNVGSIKFDYCTTAAPTIAIGCVAPTGLDTANAGFTSVTGAFTSVVSTAANSVYLSRSASSPGAGVFDERLTNIINPTSVNGETFFVRITTYTSTNTTGSIIDSGTVAAATNRPIVLTGTMPESLVFCTGALIGLTASVPDCSTATSGNITFDSLFSPTATATATSQMAASTNAGTGYIITVNGATLTSGANTITAIPSPGSVSNFGNSQFGMNLRLNTLMTSGVPSIALGLDIASASDNALLRGMPQPDYNTPDTFTYVDGAAVAKSDHLTPGSPAGYGPNPVATNAQIYTASYIVNVPGSQAAGTYTATLTYICTPTF